MAQILRGLILVLFFPATIASATNYASVVPELSKDGAFGGYLAISNISMESDVGDADLDRMILGGTYAAPLSKESAYSVGVGYALNAETDGGFEGNGFNLAANYMRQVHRMKKTQIYGYGGFEYVSENYSVGGVSGSFSYMGLKGGVSALYMMSKKIRPYAAFDLHLLNNGNFTVAGVKGDLKRDSIFALRAGMQYMLNSVYLRPELVILGEQTIIIAVGKEM